MSLSWYDIMNRPPYQLRNVSHILLECNNLELNSDFFSQCGHDLFKHNCPIGRLWPLQSGFLYTFANFPGLIRLEKLSRKIMQFHQWIDLKGVLAPLQM